MSELPFRIQENFGDFIVRFVFRVFARVANREVINQVSDRSEERQNEELSKAEILGSILTSGYK